MRKLSRPSLRKLNKCWSSQDSLSFVRQCLQLLRKGYDLDQFFNGAEEVFSEIVEEGLKALRRSQAGFIYLATNPLYGNNVYKIGLTRLTPDARMVSLQTAGVLGSFVLVEQWPSSDVDLTENRCHRLFSKKRIKGEFFHESYKVLIAGISEVIAEEHRALATLARLVRLS